MLPKSIDGFYMITATVIKGINANVRKVRPIFNFKEIGIKICFLVKLTFAHYGNLTFNLKIFEEVLPHLHGNYKQYRKDEGDPNLGKSDT